MKHFRQTPASRHHGGEIATRQTAINRPRMNHDPLEAQLSGSLTTVEDENAATVSPSFLGCETLLVVARTQSVKKNSWAIAVPLRLHLRRANMSARK